MRFIVDTIADEDMFVCVHMCPSVLARPGCNDSVSEPEALTCAGADALRTPEIVLTSATVKCGLSIEIKSFNHDLDQEQDCRPALLAAELEIYSAEGKSNKLVRNRCLERETP